MQRDVPRQPVEALDEVEQPVELRFGEPARPQLGQLLDRMPHVTGRDVREGLRDDVDVGRHHPERGTGVTDGVAHPVGLHHRHARHPLPAEALHDAFVDLGAARRLDVDVDVGQ